METATNRINTQLINQKNRMMRILILLLVGALAMPHFTSAQDIGQVGKGDALDLTGSLSFSTGYYNTSLGYNRQDPFAYRLTGNAVLSVYNWQIPFTLSYANQQFNSSNPFQQFGISPRYKWIRMHAGYSSMSFSPYTLNNHTFLGGGLEITPGKFRFSVMYGRLRERQRMVENQLMSFRPPAYKRLGYGMKIGYGTAQNHLDLIVFKGKDDTTSLSPSANLPILPAENLVVGISTRLQLLKNVSWELHASGSAYTRNLYSDPLASEEIDLPNFLTNLYEPRFSSRFNYAGHTSLNIQLGSFGIKGTYRRVQPEYKSMGVYYLKNDVEQYTIAPNFRLFKGRVSLSASLGIEQDNLMDNKAATTHRQIGSANLNWNTRGAFGMNVQYSNYQLDQNPALLNLNDTTKIARVNRNLSVMPRLIYRKDQKTHQITLYANNQTLTDNNPFTAEMTETDSYTGNLSYGYRNAKSGWNTKSSLNYTQLQTPVNEIVRYGITAGIGKSLFNDRLQTNLRASYSLNNVDQSNAGHILNFHLNLGYRVQSGHSLNLTLKLTDNETSNVNFTENMANLQYTYRFR